METTENTGLSRYSVSFGLSLALTCLLNAALVVAKEKNPVVMTALKNLTGHHWISHAAIMLVLFFGIGCLLAQANSGAGIKLEPNRLMKLVVGGVVLGAFIISGFYLTMG